MPTIALYALGRLVQTYTMEKDEILVGRLAGVDILLPVATVSRKHARIVKDGDRFCVEDLKSINGLRVNGNKVHKCFLSPGDRIEIESFKLVYEPETRQDEAVGNVSSEPGKPSPDDVTQKTPSAQSPMDMTFLNIGEFIDLDDLDDKKD